jgi:hypothetical protein
VDAPEIKPVGNAFQNIERGQKRFAEFDFDPFGNLTPDALAVLTLNIQKRHVIGHNLGVADAAFAEHAADARLGETVPLVGDDILQFAEIGQMAIDAIDAWLANGAVPPAAAFATTKPIVAPAAKEPPAVQIGELGPLAVAIGLWAAKRSEKGFDEFFQEEELTEAFPDASMDQLGIAVAELAKDGYVTTTSFISRRLPHALSTVELFLAFDPHAVGNNPAEDVVTLVDLALASTESMGAEELHKVTGWPLRRFNPAFVYMLSQIDDRRVLKGGMDEYAARGFVLLDSDRVDLRRIAARLRS